MTDKEPVVPKLRRVSKYEKLLQVGATFGGWYILSHPYRIHALRDGGRTIETRIVVDARCRCGREHVVLCTNLVRSEGCRSCASSKLTPRREDHLRNQVQPKGSEAIASRARKITAWGESKSIREWILDDRSVCKDDCLIRTRIRKGWTVERALSQVVEKLPRKRA